MGESWHLGQIMVEMGWVTWDQLQKALKIQKERRAGRTDLINDEHPTLFLGEILVKNGALTWEELDAAVRVQRDTHRMIGEILVSKQFISERDLYQALAEQSQCVFVDFTKITVKPEVLSLISYSVAKDLNIIPLVRQGKTLLVVVSDTKNLNIEMELKKRLPDFQIHYAMAAPGDIVEAIEANYADKV